MNGKLKKKSLITFISEYLCIYFTLFGFDGSII